MPGAPIDIVEVRSSEQLAAARALFIEYASTLPESAQISLAHQGFNNEMDSLPGRYARPDGCILLATLAGIPRGVVALREIPPLPGEAPRICEMKRMYVAPVARGHGIGRLLGERLLAEAAAIGYRMMKLDTEPDFAPAIALYRSLGFREIPRYNDDPVDCTMYMGRELA